MQILVNSKGIVQDFDFSWTKIDSRSNQVESIKRKEWNETCDRFGMTGIFDFDDTRFIIAFDSSRNEYLLLVNGLSTARHDQVSRLIRATFVWIVSEAESKHLMGLKDQLLNAKVTTWITDQSTEPGYQWDPQVLRDALLHAPASALPEKAERTRVILAEPAVIQLRVTEVEVPPAKKLVGRTIGLIAVLIGLLTICIYYAIGFIGSLPSQKTSDAQTMKLNK
jgi:hypothetical protein